MIAAVTAVAPAKVTKKIVVTLKNRAGGTLACERKTVSAFPDCMQDQICNVASDVISGWYLSIGDSITIEEDRS